MVQKNKIIPGGITLCFTGFFAFLTISFSIFLSFSPTIDIDLKVKYMKLKHIIFIRIKCQLERKFSH